jgi:hypothetical protein
MVMRLFEILKLGGYLPGDMEGLKAEILSSTYVNPFAEFELIWENKAAFELKFFKDHLRLSAIRTFERGKGDGSRALKWLCDLADKYHVTIVLHVQPFGLKAKKGEPKKLTVKELGAWYIRFGFVKGKYDEYTRIPKGM